MDTGIKKKIDDFFQAYSRRSVKKGEILIFAGEQPAGVFYLEKGLVKQYGVASNGGEIVLNIFKPPAFFPMAYAINKVPNKYFYQSLDDVSYRLAPTDMVLEFIKQNPDVVLNLLSRLYTGVEGVLERNFYLMGGSAPNRIMIELILEAKRFGQVEDDGSIVIRTSQHELAARVGLSRETISRDLKSVPHVKVMHGAIRILDLAALEEALTSQT